VPPATQRVPTGNTTRLWSGGGRLLNDGDESNVKACNSRAHTHIHTNTKMKIIYLFTSLISGMYNTLRATQRKYKERVINCDHKSKGRSVKRDKKVKVKVNVKFSLCLTKYNAMRTYPLLN